MTRLSILPLVACAIALGIASSSAAPDAAQAKGRYKKEGNRCVWVARDSGPNQCTPVMEGRFKKSGNSCVWNSTDRGADQCRPRTGRFKNEDGKCVWTPNDTGPDQCNPRQPK